MIECSDVEIIGMPTVATTLQSVVKKIVGDFIPFPASHYICLSNVHMCMTSREDPLLAEALTDADLVVADGKPIAFMQRLLGFSRAEQVRGYDLTCALLDACQEKHLRVGFFGGYDMNALQLLVAEVSRRWPNIVVDFAVSPPHTPLTADQHSDITSEITRANLHVLFVGLGCPKQEIWMRRASTDINCTMLGVGAVFDFLAGRKSQAPKAFQVLYLEWLYRLCSEPRRLLGRYVVTNSKFIWLALLRLCWRAS